MEIARDHRERLRAALVAGGGQHAALAGLEHDEALRADVDIIGTQLAAALRTAEAVESAFVASGLHARDEVLRMLHQLNNQLTGALSIAALVRSELAGRAGVTLVEAIDAEGRAAARAVRDIAAALRA